MPKPWNGGVSLFFLLKKGVFSLFGKTKTVNEVFCELKKFPGVLELISPYKTIMKINSSIQYNHDVTKWMENIESVSPRLIDYTALASCEPADPWLIAVALSYGYKIITNEKEKGEGCTNKIPYVCRRLGAKSFNLDTFIFKENILKEK